MGWEFVEFMMGHIVKEGQFDNYKPDDVEFYRDLYREKAMPFLRIEAETPSETQKIITQQQAEIERLESENVDLKSRLNLVESEISDVKGLIKKFLEK